VLVVSTIIHQPEYFGLWSDSHQGVDLSGSYAIRVFIHRVVNPSGRIFYQHEISCDLSQLKKTQINDISHSSSPQQKAGVFYLQQ